MKNCTFNLDSRITLLKEPLNGRKLGHLQYNLQTKYNESIKKHISGMHLLMNLLC